MNISYNIDILHIILKMNINTTIELLNILNKNE